MTDWQALRPTAEQYREFSDYVGRAHSWYKHLPLIGGGRFVVFVAPDAGFGRLVAVLHGPSAEAATGLSLVTPAEGREFTDAHPRLHYGWKTTAEYRRRFGYLDYIYRTDPDGAFARDTGTAVQLPCELEERCGFVLYPYVSGEFIEAITWHVHQEALQQLQAGVSHPAREQVLELASLTKAHRSAWSALSEPERDWVYQETEEGEKPLPGDASVALRRYVDLDKRIGAVAAELRAQEAEKVRKGLAALDEWLVDG